MFACSVLANYELGKLQYMICHNTLLSLISVYVKSGSISDFTLALKLGKGTERLLQAIIVFLWNSVI